MDKIIELKDVCFSYSDPDSEQKIQLFDHLNFSVERGSFVAILGHNGSGKSTLSRMFNGMLLPDTGNVLVNGADTKDADKQLDIRKTVGLVFQNPDNQIVSTIVEEDVAFGPENLGIKREEILERVERSLSAVGMLEYRRHATHKLSGGQKQRVAIAGILAMNPECVVLDEATAMLDPKGRSEIIGIVEKLNREMSMTVIMITHYMDEAVHASRCVVMEKGRIILDGAPREVFKHTDRLEQTGLTLPIPCRLFEILRKKGLPVGENPLTAEECVLELSKLLS